MDIPATATGEQRCRGLEGGPPDSDFSCDQYDRNASRERRL
jgi:hypothetical protein